MRLRPSVRLAFWLPFAALSGCLREEFAPEPMLALTAARGSTVASRTLSVRDIEALGLEPVATDWPFGPGRYEGVPVSKLLAAAGATSESNVAIFHCADGYSAYVPAGFFKRYPAAVVTRYDGRPPSRWPKRGGKPVGLYLGLPSAAYPELAAPRWNALWAYQLVGLEAARLENRLPPADAAHEPGRTLFVEQCIHCHAAAGAGGLKAPDLAAAARLHDKASFAAYALRPADKNPKTEMPAFDAILGPGEAESIYGYLATLEARP